MNLDEIMYRAARTDTLISAMVELTYQCNLDCFFCYNDLGLAGRPLSFEQYVEFFEDLRDLQVLYLTLTGGEPLAHPRFFDLGGVAKELGFAVRVKSNGHALRGTIAERLRKEVDPWIVDLSLHGASPESHDRQTQTPGSFQRLMDNIPGLLDLGLHLHLNTTITRWNEHEVEDMMEIAGRFQLPLNVSPTVTPRDNGDNEPLSISPTPEGMKLMFRAAAARADSDEGAPTAIGHEDEHLAPTPEGTKNCGTGASTITVNPFGEVFPCVQWRRSLGNLHASRISTIWNESEMLAEVRRLNEEAGRRRTELGSAADALPFCLGRAEMETGDPLAIYDAAIEVKRAADEVSERPTPETRLKIIYS